MKALSYALLATVLFATPAHADTVSGDLIRVVDGDTIDVPCNEFAGCVERIRFKDVDTPETNRTQCPYARQLGYAAADVLREMLRGKQVSIRRVGFERARSDSKRPPRTLAFVSIDGVDVGEKMIADGLALPWRPGRAAKMEREQIWCGR